MKIEGIDLVIARIPYKQHIVWGSRESDSDDYIFVRIRTDVGLDGWAQSLEKTAWTANSARLMTQAVRELIGPALIGQDPLRPERIWGPLRRIQGWDPAKALVENALCELQAKALGLPVWKYLGGWTNQVPVAWLVVKGSADEMLRDASQAIEKHGFRHMKVKVGDNPSEDVEGVRRIRAAFHHLFMWIDANGTYSWQEAIWVADQLRDLDIKLFEDPTRLYPVERTRQMIARCGLPVMWHGGIGSAEDARLCISFGAAAVDLKVNAIGYKASRRVVEVCEEAGIPCVIGVSSETALASIASLHFRGAFRSLEGFPAENSFFLTLVDDVLEEPITFKDGTVELSDAPGFGISVNQRVLEKYRVA